MTVKQQTIKTAIEYTGIGLHSGEPVNMAFKPAPPNTGIVFIRTDIEGQPSVQAHISHVTNTMRATTLEEGQAKVFTVEHVMAAFSGLGIDNCIVEMNSPEPAVGDGSAAVFVDLLERAGLVEQEADRQVYGLRQMHAIYDGDRFVIALPYDDYRITFTSVNSHPLLGTQQC
ncbi:MAG: UDP-3-O-acyl-N-acetylglucosamine deacetylase, partial [Veillonella sp.]|nr:UDP-3-O-acyl-N-acetylglucosamine deacetylase [Veillonella sp.]